MIEEAPNVVTEDGLRSLQAEGYLLEVVCKETGEKRHNSWYGTRVVRAVAQNGRADKMLVTSRSYLKVREFKTIVGLIPRTLTAKPKPLRIVRVADWT